MRLHKRHLRWTKEFVKKNINIIEQNYSLHPYKNKWNCYVHTVHDYETENVYMIDYKFLRKEYEKLSADVAKKYGIENYSLSDIWYNYYKRGQYQEPHTHLGLNNDIKAGGFTAVH